MRRSVVGMLAKIQLLFEYSTACRLQCDEVELVGWLDLTAEVGRLCRSSGIELDAFPSIRVTPIAKANKSSYLEPLPGRAIPLDVYCCACWRGRSEQLTLLKLRLAEVERPHKKMNDRI